tara:strand:- start:139 stop:555 length:417 start_codon:yes stop_codon:yes gene_type:complete
MNLLTHTAATRGAWAFTPHLLVLGISLLLLGACASKLLPPTQEISAAEQSLTDAEQARVAEYALPEMQRAREQLSDSRAAVAKEDMVLAKRLAQQASMNIKLASAKAELAKAEAVNTDMTKNIDVLKEEMQRKTGDTQ